jgi:rubredoxin-NAD+ reductase
VHGHLLPFVLPLMAQARALASTLAGTHTKVAYPAMPVVVKTPAWPTVVCPPPLDADGQWTVTASEEAIEARFVATSNPEQLLGFALQGKAVSQRQALAALVPAVLVD